MRAVKVSAAHDDWEPRDLHNTGDEVTKDGLHEENLGQELGPDELRLLEVQVVDDLEADGERHLREKRHQDRARPKAEDGSVHE